METNPDSALRILERIRTSNVMISSSDRALYGLLYFQALDRSNKPLQPDSLITYSLNYYQNSSDKKYLAYCYFYKGRIYKNAQRYDDATELYLKALDLSLNRKDYTLLGKIYADMGDICSMQMDYKEALRKYELSVESFQRAGKTVDASYRILEIGRTYRFEKNYKSAHKYYLQALSQTKDSLFHGVALQEIGINYYWAKQYDSAQYYLRKSIKFPYKDNNYSVRFFTLADLFFDIERYDSANYYASTALKYPANFATQRECYRLLANTEYLKGNFKQMAVFMTRFQACSDSVRKVESQTKITVLEDLHQTSENANKTKKYLIALGWLLPFIIAISLYVLYRLRKRNKGKEKELEEAEIQIIEKQNLLVDSLIQKIEETRSLQANVYKKASIAQREQMDKEIYNVCLHVNDWDAFKRLMNKTFNNIVSILEKEFPEITRKELTWCCLFLLDIRTQDMALILDTQPASLYKMKSRLTQKLSLKSTKELDQLLKEKSDRK
ncbi:tetratricopeptide repeat protein [Paludibacter propionicigenes]|nr:tetratricopeptide repeat protein [Paludibacter propionicigenes]